MPGQNGNWWMLTNSTSREPWKIVFVPLPWCTSQSTTSTRSAPSASSACRHATATLANRQKPMAVVHSAWWPGGRSAENPVRSPPDRRLSTSAHAPPAARSAASYEPGTVGVSASNARLAALNSRTCSMYSRGWTRSSCSSVAPGASTGSQPSQSRLSSSASMALIRSARSGWPKPVSCSSDAGWRKNGGMSAGTVPARLGWNFQHRRRRCGRRRRRPLRRPRGGGGGSERRARQPLAACRDGELLGSGRNRRGDGGGRLAGPARRGHARRGAGHGARERGARALRGVAGARARPPGAGRPLRRRPRGQPRTRAGGRALAAARGARGRRGHRPPNHANAVGARRDGRADNGPRAGRRERPRDLRRRPLRGPDRSAAHRRPGRPPRSRGDPRHRRDGGALASGPRTRAAPSARASASRATPERCSRTSSSCSSTPRRSASTGRATASS